MRLLVFFSIFNQSYQICNIKWHKYVVTFTVLGKISLEGENVPHADFAHFKVGHMTLLC